VIELERTALGTIGVDERVLGGLAEHTARGAPGVHAVRKPEVLVEDDRSVSVSLAVVVEPGAVMPEVGRAVQERVAGALTTAIEPRGVRVDVTVEGVGG
jgi:uncharacterized alkaline shock family protein YloU